MMMMMHTNNKKSYMTEGVAKLAGKIRNASFMREKKSEGCAIAAALLKQ